MVEWLSLWTKPLWFSFLGCNFHQYIEWRGYDLYCMFVCIDFLIELL